MITMSSTTNSTTNWWKGWQMPVMVGTPVLIGSAIYLYRRRRNAGKPIKSDSNSTLKIQPKEDKDKANNPLKTAVNHRVDGNKLFQKEQYLKAIESYASAISESPTDNVQHLSTFYHNRAASHEMLKKYDEVIADCDKAIQLDQRYVKALLRRAKAHEALGNTSGALNDITAVCFLKQFQNSNNLMMTDMMFNEQSKLVKSLILKSLFKNRAPKMPSRHFVHNHLISYSKDPILKNIESTEVPNIEEMLETYEQKRAESGDTAITPQYLLLKGTVDILKGNFESAEADLEKLLKLSDCDNDIKVNALIKLATIKVQDIRKKDGINEALKHFEEAIKLDADNPDIYLHRAQIYLLTEKVEEARKDLETCCSLDEKFASALAQKLHKQFRCSTRFSDSKSIDKNVSDLDRGIEKFSNSSELYSFYSQEADDDDFDRSSLLSSATTTTLGYWDVEPNLHFFKLYQNALEELNTIESPRVDRTQQLCCETPNEFKAKVHCIRLAFLNIFDDIQNRHHFKDMGQEILEILLNHSLRDPRECIAAYFAFLNFVSDTTNHDMIKEEIAFRSIKCLSFYDLVLDYIILDSFDDLDNPPSAVTSVASNRWLSAGFRELALQTAVSAVLRRKRSKLTNPEGFFAHFYSILDHISPVLAWGFLGSDQDLKLKCFLVKESLQEVIRDYFSFDRVRYTNLNDLCEDILRVTKERYWELNNKLSILST